MAGPVNNSCLRPVRGAWRGSDPEMVEMSCEDGLFTIYLWSARKYTFITFSCVRIIILPYIDKDILPTCKENVVLMLRDESARALVSPENQSDKLSQVVR